MGAVIVLTTIPRSTFQTRDASALEGGRRGLAITRRLTAALF